MQVTVAISEAERMKREYTFASEGNLLVVRIIEIYYFVSATSVAIVAIRCVTRWELYATKRKMNKT